MLINSNEVLKVDRVLTSIYEAGSLFQASAQKTAYISQGLLLKFCRCRWLGGVVVCVPYSNVLVIFSGLTITKFISIVTLLRYLA